ncbi:5596_t:CDS:2, partial [Cetraspora pellucida]
SKGMSSTFALASSLSPLETLETCAYDDDEYVPLLTFCQHSLDNQESENEDEDESTLETDTRDVCKKSPMPPHWASIRLPSHLDGSLRQIGIGACGTIRKTASSFLKELKIDKGVKLNWDVCSGVVINDTLAVLWQDNGPVTMLTMIHRLVGEEWEVERKRRRPRETSSNAIKVRMIFGSELKKKLKILKIIDDYNHNMNGVDVSDQLRHCDYQRIPNRQNFRIEAGAQRLAKDELDVDRKTPHQSNLWCVLEKHLIQDHLSVKGLPEETGAWLLSYKIFEIILAFIFIAGLPE